VAELLAVDLTQTGTSTATQVSEYVWEIPTSYKSGMNVPARIYATKKLLDQMDRGVLDQVTNVASLPGIVRYSYAMADAHWGYGFPIGGVAAFDIEKGIISPGGVGFDINCLHPDSRIYDADGIWRKVKDIDLNSQRFVTLDVEQGRRESTSAILLLRRSERNSLLRITTNFGRELMVTGDHPVLTKRGMVVAQELTNEDCLTVTGLEGLEYSAPRPLRIVTDQEIRLAMTKMGVGKRGNAMGQTLHHLQMRGLSEVGLSDHKISILLKLLGFVMGDGNIPRVRSGHYVSFFGRKEDLEQIKADLARLGFRSHSYHRRRHHGIKTRYDVSEFDYDEHTLFAPSTALAVLLVALGAPYGKKSVAEYRVPTWLFSAENWQKKLFMGAYFGAELSKPITSNGFDFQMPDFSVSKLEKLRANALSFLQDFRVILESLGVKTATPSVVGGYRYTGIDGETVGFRLCIMSNTENLLRFFSTVGYLYNREKDRLASLAALYLSYIQGVRDQRNSVRQAAIQMYASGSPTKTIISTLSTPYAGPNFIRHSLWSGRPTPRAWGCLRFEEFTKAYGLGECGFAHDKIQSISKIPYDGPVFDVTIDDENHNFVADGVVVSNCGMRLIRTNLSVGEVKPKVRELVDLIFQLVPAGVGVKGFVKVNQSEFDEVMRWGVKWCVENGLGWQDDISHVEEGGYLKGADPSKVSGQAVSRGLNQLGTLGSGNHYLEIQVVDPKRFFDTDLAAKFGIVKNDQVLIMVHCGSRGFGHQVGTDYLRVFDGAMKRYGMTVRDRELACAPFSSKEGKDYYGAMVCAANMAFANRQVIVARVREAFQRVFHRDAESLDMHLIYDVCHNIAKVEKHSYDGFNGELLVHRKGATRSFGPGHHDIPEVYRELGQPVIIGGSMETGSYLLLGTTKAMQDTFGSTAHGSGRTMSRTAAKKTVRGNELQKSMQDRGIYVKAVTMEGLAEEAGFAYKDISEVVETMDRAGISKKVVALRPIGNIKG
jgi:tRNA-splicing ligase RtcB